MYLVGMEMESKVMEQAILPRKWKKTRRGKKRKPFDRQHALEDLTMSCGCSGSDSENMSSLDSDKQNSSRRSSNGKSGRKMVRPYRSPRAPHNSTQFLIDDRLDSKQDPTFQLPEKNVSPAVCSYNDGGFYDQMYNGVDFSVTVSDQCLSPDGECVALSDNICWKTSPAYSDVDYKYEQYPNVEDFLTFQEQDFEQEFQHVRERTLHDKSKNELISDVTDVVQTIAALKEELKVLENRDSTRNANVFSGDNSSHCLDLEEQMITLQRNNDTLKAENNTLRLHSSTS